MLALEHPEIGLMSSISTPICFNIFLLHCLTFICACQHSLTCAMVSSHSSITPCVLSPERPTFHYHLYFFLPVFFGYLLCTYVSSFESWMKILLQATSVCHTMFCIQITHPHQYKQDGGINPHTFKISVVIFHTVSHSILLRCQFWEFCIESFKLSSNWCLVWLVL